MELMNKNLQHIIEEFPIKSQFGMGLESTCIAHYTDTSCHRDLFVIEGVKTSEDDFLFFGLFVGKDGHRFMFFTLSGIQREQRYELDPDFQITDLGTAIGIPY